MLLILFQIDNQLYGLDSQFVAEIIPSIPLTQIPNAPTFIPGIFNYRGKIIPVLDISSLIKQNPSKPFLSTRLIIVDFPLQKITKTLAILAEKVMDTLEIDHSLIKPSPVSLPNSPFLGHLLEYHNHIIQIIDIHNLVPHNLHNLLFNISSDPF